uniref:Phenoloxidase-activating factor 2 n=1 Tax=Corethrella appendiculata TaxID=1370023 RepID=U5EUN9_9DIPT
MFLKFLLCLTITIITVNAQAQNLDDLINELFTTSKTNEPIRITEAPVQRPILPAPGIGGTTGNADLQGVCENGECVKLFQCTANNTINEDGEGLIDIRFDDTNPCQHYTLRCCTEYKEGIPDIPPEKTHDGYCGYRNPNGVGFRITGNRDSESEYGEFPWMVAILKMELFLDHPISVYLCGGSIIHPSVILTAAHCVQNKKAADLKIRAAEWDTQTTNEIYPTQDRQVAEIIVHENYYKGGLFNDVALLILTTPLELGNVVQAVCLPEQNMKFDYSRCYASGWGKDVYGKEGAYSAILKKVDLPIVPNDKCDKILKGTSLGARFNLHESFICAGGEPGKDTCKGDGGSPLVCPITEGSYQNYQAGIVAFGVGCGENQIPGVYADVAKFRHWIDGKMQLYNYDTKYYTP